MKPLDFPLLADENIHGEVVKALAAKGKDIRSVWDEQLVGQDDVVILRRAHAGGRVVLTHDSGDFGQLAIQAGEPFTGIIFLRPGHRDPAFVLESLDAVESIRSDVTPPFVLVADRRSGRTRIRLRSGV